MTRTSHTQEAMDVDDMPSKPKDRLLHFSLFDMLCMYSSPAYFIWLIFFSQEKSMSMYFMMHAALTTAIIAGMTFFILSIKRRLELQQMYILNLMEMSKSDKERSLHLTRIQLMIDMNLLHVVSLLVFTPFMGAMYFIWYRYIGRFHL